MLNSKVTPIVASDEWISITIKYQNKCIECQEDILVGEKQLWKKGTGVKHTKCGNTNLYADGHQISIPENKNYPNKLSQIVKGDDIHDDKIYSFKDARNLTYCQFCGRNLPLGGDTYINCERKSCYKCFAL
tara:strand:+ start:85 stop:477 length:393 start_codon:yes stop_codon:yes gene_type:complete